MATALSSPILQDALPRDEAAAYIGVEVSTMAGSAHTGKYRDILPCARIGKRLLQKEGSRPLDRKAVFLILWPIGEALAAIVPPPVTKSRQAAIAAAERRVAAARV